MVGVVVILKHCVDMQVSLIYMYESFLFICLSSFSVVLSIAMIPIREALPMNTYLGPNISNSSSSGTSCHSLNEGEDEDIMIQLRPVSRADFGKS